jgi:signal transduction histidine kinase
MRLRYKLVTPVLLATLLLGIFVSFNESARDEAMDRGRQLVRDSSVPRDVSGLFGTLSRKRASLHEILSFFTEDLLFYGMMGILGLLIVTVALRRVRHVVDEEQPESMSQLQIKELTEEKEKAGKLAELKFELFSAAFPAIRTSATVIVGYVDCLLDGFYGDIDPKHREILRAVSEECNRLNSTIEKVLSNSELDTDARSGRGS